MKTFWLTKEECTGCGACSSICPVDAISLICDKSGFEYPIICEKCIDCNKCEDVCRGRLRLEPVSPSPLTYAVSAVEDEVRFSSTSGGAFTELATVVLAEDGVVFGASYSGGVRVEHTFTERTEGLSSLRQSKYAQSSTNNVFRDVAQFLKKGRLVLFCGTPCQIVGLKSYLGKDYERLLTVDFICRGVNSPKALEAWASEIGHSRGFDVERIWFKYKVNGWRRSPRCTRVDYADGSFEIFDQEENLFMCGYLDQNLYMRSSCAQCEFKGDNRRSDITLGDFWGLDEALVDDEGTTLVLLNTDKGRELFDAAAEGMNCEKRSFSEAERENVFFRKSINLNPRSEAFFSDLSQMSFSEALKRNSRRKSMLSKVKEFAKRLVGC